MIRRRFAPRAPAGPGLVWRLFLATAAVVAAVLAIVLGALSASAARTADVTLARGLDASRRHVAALLEGRERALTSATLVFAQSPAFRTLLIEPRPADLLDQAREAVERTGATWVQIADANGLRVAKSDEPAAPPVMLAGTALVGGALGGDVVAGAGVAGDTAIFLGVAVPVTVTTQVAGVLMAAQALDLAVARAIKAETGSETLIYLLDSAGRPRVAATTLSREAAIDSALAARPAPAGGRAGTDAAGTDSGSTNSGSTGAAGRIEVTTGGVRYVGQALSLRSARGDALGGVVTLRSRAAELAPFTALRRGIALAGLFGLALAFALSYAVARHVTRPILALTAATRRAVSGDFGAAADVPVDSSGEIGALAEAVRSVLSDVQGRHVIAEFLAGPFALAAPRAGAAEDERRAALAAVGEQGGPFAAGRTVARRYEIDRALGVGGAGIVYRAVDRELGEVVAIKTLRPEVIAGGADALERFKDEIRLARRISHPSVVRIHDLGESDGTYFITMEYVAGVSLHDVLERLGRMPPPVVVAVGRQLCQALDVAHRQGVIHRDVKPQNVMLQPDGALKVMDFGVARLAERSGGMTASGMVVGTPAYMAPEQLMGEPIDARVDVYAAGVALYECLTGRRPVEAASPAGLVARILAGAAVAPHLVRPDVPVALSEAIMRAIARDRAERPQSAAELDDLLARAGHAPAHDGRAPAAARDAGELATRA